jgi:hypothetical protein
VIGTLPTTGIVIATGALLPDWFRLPSVFQLLRKMPPNARPPTTNNQNAAIVKSGGPLGRAGCIYGMA